MNCTIRTINPGIYIWYTSVYNYATCRMYVPDIHAIVGVTIYKPIVGLTV